MPAELNELPAMTSAEFKRAMEIKLMYFYGPDLYDRTVLALVEREQLREVLQRYRELSVPVPGLDKQHFELDTRAAQLLKEGQVQPPRGIG